MIRAAAASALVVSILALIPASVLYQTTAAAPGSSSRTHAITRNVTKAPPVALPDSYTVAQDSTLTIATLGILTNDTLNDSTSIASYGATTGAEQTVIGTPTPTAEGGSVTVNTDGSFSYTPAAGFVGTDSFQYILTNLEGTASADVTLTVLAPLPLAVADSYSTSPNGPLGITAPGVLTNDTVSGGAISSYGAVTGLEQTTIGTSTATAENGSVTLNADGSFSYTPATDFTGTDTFEYVLTNSTGSATGLVTITIFAPPTALADLFGTPQGTTLTEPASSGVLTNDTVNGATIVSYGASTGAEDTVLGTSTPTAQNGSVSLSGDGSFVYVPTSSFSGVDSFKYVIQNPAGSATATVSINVQAKPQPLPTTLTVTTPNDEHAYVFAGISGLTPALTLVRGTTYTIQMNASSDHPFEILGAPPGAVTHNNITHGTITFKVPMTATNYAYQCSVHFFGNGITTVDP